MYLLYLISVVRVAFFGSWLFIRMICWNTCRRIVYLIRGPDVIRSRVIGAFLIDRQTRKCLQDVTYLLQIYYNNADSVGCGANDLRALFSKLELEDSRALLLIFIHKQDIAYAYVDLWLAVDLVSKKKLAFGSLRLPELHHSTRILLS